jgi:hypothetical protein
VQGAHAAQQIRETLQIAGFFQLLAAHHRREAHDLGARIALPGDVAFEAVDQIDVQLGARIHTVDAHRAEQRVAQIGKGILGCAVGRHNLINH